MPLTYEDLARFTKIENYHTLGFNLTYLRTDGVQFLVEEANAIWMVYSIFTWQSLDQVGGLEFQVWQLLNHTQPALLFCWDGVDPSTRLVEQYYFCLDFPLPELTLYLWVDENSRLLMLPSEFPQE